MLGDSLESENDSAIKIDNSVYSKTFFWMFLGLLATGIISVFTYMQISSSAPSEMLGFFPIVALVEVVVVLIFSLLFKNLSPTAVTILYFIYAAVNGVSLSTIFFISSLQSWI